MQHVVKDLGRLPAEIEVVDTQPRVSEKLVFRAFDQWIGRMRIPRETIAITMPDIVAASGRSATARKDASSSLRHRLRRAPTPADVITAVR
jgi:hypothetical protein